jgi:hypothetical protein
MHVAHAAKAAAATTLSLATPNAILRLAELEADADSLVRFVWINEATLEARVYPGTGSAHYDVTLHVGRRPTCTCGATEVDRFLCAHIALVASRTCPAVSLQSLIFPEDSVHRWRAQYNAAGAFNVPSVTDLETHDLPVLNKPTAIPRGRGAPKKKRKCGRRDAVKRYAKRMRREGGLAALAVAPTRARAEVPPPAGARAGGSSGGPRGSKRARSPPRAGTTAPAATRRRRAT